MVINWKKAVGVVKDRASIGLAKIYSPRLEAAIVKATSHDDMAVDEKYTKEILHLTSISFGYGKACLRALTKRIKKTHNWIVAIKALLLTHRLLREENSAFQEIIRTVNVFNVSDEPQSNSWDYSAFVRTYAAYLDARLDCFTFSYAKTKIGSRQDDYSSEFGKTTYSVNNNRSRFHTNSCMTYVSVESLYQKHKIPVKELELDMLIEVLPNLQHMLERVLACYPTGVVSNHRLVQVSLYMIVKDSFQIYSDLCDGIRALLNLYFDMKLEDCTRTFDIYARFAKQSDLLSSFYKGMNICRPSEYPPVEKVSQDYLYILEDYLRDRSRSARPHQSNDSRESNTKKLLGLHSEKEKDPVTYDSMYEIKALPAPRTETPHEISNQSTISKPEKQPNLIDLGDQGICTETGHDKMTLLSSSPDTIRSTGVSRWELASVSAASSQLADVEAPPMVGHCDRFHFETTYNQVNSKHNSATALLGLDMAIVKATCHDGMNVNEKYTQKILHLTAASLGYTNSCLQALTKRMSKTRDWIRAIKVLLLTHRLLREGNPAFQENMRAVSRCSLNVSNLGDESHSETSDYSAFVRIYAAYLYARLDCFIFASAPGRARSRQDDYSSGYGETRFSLNNSSSNFNTSSYDAESPYRKQKILVKEMDPDMLIQILPNLQNMLDRVLGCRPTGAAKNHPLVQVSLYMIVKDSFQIYSDLCEGIGVLLNVYFDMKLEHCSGTFKIYARFAEQSDSLSSFYKGMGICRPPEYPPVQKVSQDYLDTLEIFLTQGSRSALLEQPNPSYDSSNQNSLDLHSEKKADPVNSATDDIMYGMKASPAPPAMKTPERISHQSATSYDQCAMPYEQSAMSEIEKQANLVGFEDEAASAESGHNRMTSALLSSSSEASIPNSWATFDIASVQEFPQKNTVSEASRQASANAAAAPPILR